MSTLTNYEGLLALSTSPALTLEMREYLVKVLEEHRLMRMALESIRNADLPSLTPRLAADTLAKVQT